MVRMASGARSLADLLAGAGTRSLTLPKPRAQSWPRPRLPDGCGGRPRRPRQLEVPAVVLVHGSGRSHRRRLVAGARPPPRRMGFACSPTTNAASADRRASTRSIGPSNSVRMFDLLAATRWPASRRSGDAPTSIQSRVGLLGFSQAGWIAPLAASRSNASRLRRAHLGPGRQRGRGDRLQPARRRRSGLGAGHRRRGDRAADAHSSRDRTGTIPFRSSRSSPRRHSGSWASRIAASHVARTRDRSNDPARPWAGRSRRTSSPASTTG